MKWAVGQVVYSQSYDYRYEILEVTDRGYKVKNLDIDSERGGFWINKNSHAMKKFEEDCVPVEILESPVWKALQ